MIACAAMMQLPAYAVIGSFADLQAPLDKSTLIVITVTIFLAWALMLSQAIESVTRVFYARADLDLIMSSPLRLTEVFSVRLASLDLTFMPLAYLLSTRLGDVLLSAGALPALASSGPHSDSRARAAWPPSRPHQGVQRRLAATCAATEGIFTAAPRALAGVTDPDAIALSGAAGLDAVAKFFGQLGRDRAHHARHRDGGRPARGRSGLADNIGRGRRRSGGDRAAAALARHPRQDPGGANRDLRPLLTPRPPPSISLPAPGP